jgi:hypothetical protein
MKKSKKNWGYYLKTPKFLNNPEILGHYFGFDRLNETHGIWIKKCWSNDKTYVLQAHRNSYKTTACIIIGSIWCLIFNPDNTVLIVRKEYEGAASILGAITKIYESDKMKALYNELGYKTFQLNDSRKDTLTLSTKTTITKEGSIDSMGIGGAITGRHYDKIICDDIITLKDRVSHAERERSKEFIRELANVKNAGGSITFTGTPWHKSDAFSILPEADKYPLGSISIPELTKENLAEIRAATTHSLWSANYELVHISSDDRIFTDAKFGHWRNDLPGSIGLCDTAYSGTHYTALSIAQIEGNHYNVKGWVWRKSIVDLYQIITNLLTDHNCGTLLIETNADKGLSRLEMMKYYPNVIGYAEHENKHNKIVGYVKNNWSKILFDEDSQSEYLNQVFDYTEGIEPDDAPDSLAALMRVLAKRNIDTEKSIKVEDMFEDYKY